jgi:hypothetical protein
MGTGAIVRGAAIAAWDPRELTGSRARSAQAPRKAGKQAFFKFLLY